MTTIAYQQLIFVITNKISVHDVGEDLLGAGVEAGHEGRAQARHARLRPAQAHPRPRPTVNVTP